MHTYYVVHSSTDNDYSVQVPSLGVWIPWNNSLAKVLASTYYTTEGWSGKVTKDLTPSEFITMLTEHDISILFTFTRESHPEYFI